MTFSHFENEKVENGTNLAPYQRPCVDAGNQSLQKKAHYQGFGST